MSCMHGSDNVTGFSVHSLCFENIYLYNELYTCIMSCMHGSDNVTGFSVQSLCFENIDLYNELYAWFRQCDWFLST